MIRNTLDRALATLLLWQADAPKDLSNLEAARDLGMKRKDLSALHRSLPAVVEEDSATEFSCPRCQSQIALPSGTRNAYCEACGAIWHRGQFPTKLYTLDRSSAERHLLDKMSGELTDAGVKVKIGYDPSRLQLSVQGVSVSIGLVARIAKLKDYQALRGSLEDPAKAVAGLVAPLFDDVLQYYARNAPAALLIDTMDWLCQEELIVSRVKEQVRQVSVSIRVSTAITTRFEELKVADDVGEQFHQLLRDLPPLSLQILAGSPSSIGNRFQRDTITALNVFTPLKVLPVGGTNQEDGVLRFFVSGKRPQWYPVGIKSFKGDPTSDPYFRVRDAGEQIRKYARAYLQEGTLASEVDLPAYILIAHDFDVASADTTEAVEAFQQDIGLPLKLLPVRSILALIKGFAELRPDRIPDQPLVDFVRATGSYLGQDRVETLLAAIRKFQKQESRDPRIVRVRDRLRKQHA